MVTGPRQADDLDLMLRDTVRADWDAAPDTAHVWTGLRRRIEAQARPARQRRTVGTLGYLAPREWTMDRHLMSLVRVVR